MRIVGVDPGLGITGYAVVDLRGRQPFLVEAGTIRGKPEWGLPERLHCIRADLAEVMKEFQPEVMGLESLFSQYRFPRSALQMAHARGVVCLVAAESGVPVVDISPREVKNALVGIGSATKGQVQQTIRTLFRLAELPSPPDVADAIAIATAVGFRVARTEG